MSATAWLARHAGRDAPIVLIGEAGLIVRYQSALRTFDVPSVTNVSRVPSAWSTTAFITSPLGP